MKNPLNYYGGKTTLAPTIVGLMAQSQTRGYAEIFAGGLSVFFQRQPAGYEIVNDVNGNVVAFYTAMKLHFKELHEKISTTLHCEHSHRVAREIYHKPEGHDVVTRAWALWVSCNMSFGGSPGNGFQFVKNTTDNWTPAVRVKNKRDYFANYRDRLEKVVIMNRDAVEVAKLFDSPDLLIYADPPYVGANQGHYGGYTQQQFNELLLQLETGKSKFILSSYPNQSLNEFVERNEWSQISLDMRKGVLGDSTMKTEVITFNFEINKQGYLF